MKKLIFAIWFLSAVAVAQVFTNVTATLQDSSGQVWSNATWTAEFSKPTGAFNVTYSNGGQPVTPNQTGLANSSGVFTVTLDDNILGVTPGKTAWRFTICPNANVTSCNITTLTITGATMDISAQLNAILTVPSVNSGSTIVRAYNDTEVNGTFGSLYLNSIDNSLRQCQTLVCTGSGWVAIAGGGVGGSGTVGTGTVGQFALYNGPTAVVGTAALTFSSVAPIQIIATQPLLTTDIQLTSGSRIYGAGSTTLSPIAGRGAFAIMSGNVTNVPAISINGGSFASIMRPTVNGTGIAATNTIFNFNATTPVAPTNGINVVWQTSGSGTSQISAAVVGDGVASDCLNGLGSFVNCNAGSKTFANGNCTQSTASTTCSFSLVGAGQFTSGPPNCVVTPMTSGITSYFLSGVTNSGGIAIGTINYAPSQAATFSVICVG